MAIQKDDRILDLLTRLDLQDRDWCIQDHWEADLCAIGIRSNSSDRRLVYISIYNLATGRYDCECEKLSGHDPTDYQVIHEGRDLTYEQLLSVLEHFLS